ncbi:MAG TPA: MarC family protein [Pseudorhodoplanes sp.]|nr:MarC family protein [Pseudorhodoplanes sp.]
MWSARLGEFVALFLVINPIEVVPGYLGMVGHVRKSATKARIALQGVAIAFVILVFFQFAGKLLLEQLHVPLRAFQIAGGIMVFLVALDMVRGASHDSEDVPLSHLNLAIYPLAVPKIAGPAAMLTIIVISDDDRYNLAGQLGTVAVLAVVMAIQFALLLAAVPVSRLLGRSGAGVISRIMGMILAALAVSTTLSAIADWLNLPKL